MKKLMMTLAVSLAATALVAVESVNIVGYQTISIPQGYKMATSTFVPVGSDGTTLRLGDIVPNANFDYFAGDNVQFFNPTGSGSVTNTASYMDGYGWFEFETPANMLDDMEIPAGTGIFVYTAGTDVDFLVAGEVALGQLILGVPAGYTVVGNSSPVAITLGDIVPNANFDYFAGDNVQFFNPTGSGSVTTTASYMDGYGWFEFETPANMLTDVVLNSGDAFFVYTASSSVEFTFPALVVE